MDSKRCSVTGVVFLHLLVILVGVFALLSGISTFRKSYADSRGLLISQLKEKIKSWNDGQRDCFDNLTLSVEDSRGTLAPQSLTKIENEDNAHELTDLRGDVVEEWVPLYYYASVLPSSGSQSRQMVLTGEAAGGNELSTRPWLWKDTQSSLVQCKQVVYEVHPCETECTAFNKIKDANGVSYCPQLCPEKCQERFGGQYIDGTCYGHQTLQEINVVASSTGSSGSSSSWSFVGFSLHPSFVSQDTQAITVDDDHADPGTYKASPGPCPPPSPSFTVPFIVRSEHDPYVQAALMTGYTFDFGNTREENASAGVEGIKLGATLIGIPFLLLCVVYKCAKDARKRYPQPSAPTEQPLGLWPHVAPGVVANTQLDGGQYVPPQTSDDYIVDGSTNPVHPSVPSK